MPNWIKGTLKLRGKQEDIRRFFREGLQPSDWPKPEDRVGQIIDRSAENELYFEFNREPHIVGTRRAFITGVIYENDQDFPVARALATELIAAKAFEPVDKFTIEQAKKAIDSCRKVICCRKEFGSLETANKELFEYAKQNGKEVEITERLG